MPMMRMKTHRNQIYSPTWNNQKTNKNPKTQNKTTINSHEKMVYQTLNLSDSYHWEMGNKWGIQPAAHFNYLEIFQAIAGKGGNTVDLSRHLESRIKK